MIVLGRSQVRSQGIAWCRRPSSGGTSSVVPPGWIGRASDLDRSQSHGAKQSYGSVATPFCRPSDYGLPPMIRHQLADISLGRRMEILQIFKDYGEVIAAIVIAISTAYTAAILRRQNRIKGWLRLSGGRRQRVNIYGAIALTGVGDVVNSDEDPSSEKDPGGHEVTFHVSNTGRYEENVETAYYYMVGQGWQRVPTQNPVGFKIIPPSLEDPNPRFEEVSKTEYPKVNTPFVVPPERSHELVYRLQPPHDEKLSEITCIKIVTLKGESIHCRLSDAGRRFSWARRILCHLGRHR